MRLLILPILYFLSIELVLVRPSLFFWIALVLVTASILGVLQISKKKRLFSAICPLMFLISSFFLLPLIGGKILVHIYVILAAFIFWLSFLQLHLFFSSEERLLKISLDLGKSINLITCFLWFSGIYGLYINFYPSIWLVSLAMLLALPLFSFHFLRLSLFTPFSASPQRVDPSTSSGSPRAESRGDQRYFSVHKRFILPSLVITLMIFQIFWALQFWPFAYLTIGAVLVIIYYVILDIWQNKFRGILSKRLILNRLTLGGVLVVLVLATSKWLPF